MEPTSTTPQFSLSELRSRRVELRDSMSALEQALAAPVAGDPNTWTDSVLSVLEQLSEDFQEHIAITEGDDGLYAELRQIAPRLSDATTRLATEHVDIQELIDELLTVEDVEDGRTADRNPEGLRGLGTTLLMRLVRHRQRGSDLVYDAYEVDIGGDT